LRVVCGRTIGWSVEPEFRQVAAMRLRSRRWRGTAFYLADRPVARVEGQWITGPGRRRPVRRWIRTWALLSVAGLVRVAHWWPVLAGVVLTVTGILLRDEAAGAILLPGLMLLMSALLIPPSPKVERMRRALLERELAAYTTVAQRHDLETTLNRYPDVVTCELRDILARQAAAVGRPGLPGAGRC
jgi:hypothetical protein